MTVDGRSPEAAADYPGLPAQIDELAESEGLCQPPRQPVLPRWLSIKT